MKIYHYIVSGRVQGVCFRHYTVLEAEKNGLSGTVRNLPDGSVEVFVQGEEAAIARFESFLHIGPRSARVERVEKEISETEEVYRGFDIGWS
jgi:acylphosphatase